MHGRAGGANQEENPQATHGEPGINQGRGKPGYVKPDNLLSFGWSEFTFTNALLTDAQPIDNLMVALRMASLQILQQAAPLSHHDK